MKSSSERCRKAEGSSTKQVKDIATPEVVDSKRTAMLGTENRSSFGTIEQKKRLLESKVAMTNNAKRRRGVDRREVEKYSRPLYNQFW